MITAIAMKQKVDFIVKDVSLLDVAVNNLKYKQDMPSPKKQVKTKWRN